MHPEFLSHYTMDQFSLVFVMMILFFTASYTGFMSVYYSADKRRITTISVLSVLLILSVIFIETAYTMKMIAIFIVIFRTLNILMIIFMLMYIVKNKNFQRAQKWLCSLTVFAHVSIFILSFHHHYTPLYLIALPVLLYGRIFRPAKLDILIEREASQILHKLKEAILIISAKRELLSINSSMWTLLNGESRDELTLDEISFGLAGNKNAIDLWFSKEITEHVFSINNKHYLINTVNVPQKGLIITASDIHEDVIVQKELEESIAELDNLTKTLQLYSQSSELLAIREERARVYRHIQDIISRGLNKLNEDLMEIKQEPPDNYETILYKSRSLLNEVRTIVANWRSISGADI